MTEHTGVVAASRAEGPSPALSPAELAAKYGLTVSGRRPSLAEYTRELWSRRHFILAYATARVSALYTTARLGSAWQVVTPLLNAAVYYLIFGVLLGTNKGIPNFIAYLCTGVFVFQFTQSAVMAGTRSIADNLNLVRALHFPRACLPIAATVIQLQQLLFSMIVLVAIILGTGEPVTLRWFLVVPILVLQTLFNAGLALILARIGARTTDLSQLMPFVIRTWMYGSGIFWSVSNITSGHASWVATLLNLNPALLFNELMRYALMDSVSADSIPHHSWPAVLGWSLLVSAGGYVFFWRAEEEYGRG
ncbi:ABC transporter permease [Streptacidiphilus sp. PAMC 29251]